MEPNTKKELNNPLIFKTPAQADSSSISDAFSSNKKKIIIRQFSTKEPETLEKTDKPTFLDENEEVEELNVKKFHKKVIFLFDQLFEFENRVGQLAGIYYIIIVILCSSILIMISTHAQPEIPGLQLLFIIVLVSFLLNYNLVREGHIPPYLEVDEDHYKAKWTGILSVISIGSYFYAIQTSAKPFVMLIFLLSWLISFLIEKIYYKEGVSILDSFSCLIVTIGSVIVNLPLLKIEEGEYDFKSDFFIGIAFSILGSLCIAGISVIFSRLNTHNILSINHVILLVIMIFVPVYFPLQNLRSIGVFSWIVSILLGFLFFFISIFFIRSLQLEKATVVLVYLNLLVAANITIETIFVSGILRSIWTYCGVGLIYFGLYLIGKEAFTRVNIDKDKEIMMKHNLKDDIMRESNKEIEMNEMKI